MRRQARDDGVRSDLAERPARPAAHHGFGFREPPPLHGNAMPAEPVFRQEPRGLAGIGIPALAVLRRAMEGRDTERAGLAARRIADARAVAGESEERIGERAVVGEGARLDRPESFLHLAVAGMEPELPARVGAVSEPHLCAADALCERQRTDRASPAGREREWPARAYQRVSISTPMPCTGLASSLSRRVAFTPTLRSGAPFAGARRQPRL